MRVALLHSGGAPERAARELDAALRARGHTATLIGGGGLALAEKALTRRGFTPGLSSLPSALRALDSGNHDVAHAFDPVAATGALVWGRGSGLPVVATFVDALDRATVANTRLRLRLLSAAIEESDAVIAASADARSALLRWAAVDAPVVRPGDASGHEALYRRLLRGAG